MSIGVFGYSVVMLCLIHVRMSLYFCSYSLVCICGIYAVMAMLGEPSCGVIVVALIWSMRCVGVGIGVTSLYTSLRVARMVPADLRLVVGSSFRDVCVNLYSFKASLLHFS